MTTTDPLEAAIGLLDELRDAIGMEHHVSDEIRAAARYDKRLVLVDWYLRAAAVKTVTSVPDHPPVPEQAADADELALIEDSAYLWQDWRPGAWPVPSRADSRGFSWHVFSGGR